MSLFVVRHQHEATSCPARDPVMGAMLLTHISQQNARKYGIDLHGEGVLDGKHTFYLIMEAETADQIESFMQPFQQAGQVEIWPASACEKVVDRAGC